MQIGNIHTKLSWLLLIGTLFLSICFASLGFWQLDRADEKAIIQADIEQSIAAAAIKLSSPIGEHWKDFQYRKIEARGHFGSDFLIYLDNRVYQGKAGYHIISPFYVDDEQTDNKQSSAVVLVNRGWIEVGIDRSILPLITTTKDSFILKGRLSSPRSKP